MQWNNERGATLIEALAASVILGIVILVFVQVSGYWTLAGFKSDTNAEALRIAEDELNQARIYAKQNNTLPANKTVTLNDHTYTVNFQSNSLSGSLPVVYNTNGFKSNHISSQSVVLIGTSPTLVTVTISWSSAS